MLSVMEPEVKNDFSNYGQKFQLATLRLFIEDKPFSSKIRTIIDPSYFDNKYSQWFCEIILDQISKFKSTPTYDDLKMVVETSFKPAVAKVYLTTLDNIKSIDISRKEFVEDEVSNFCFRKYALKKLEEEKNNILLGNFEAAKGIAFSIYKPLTTDSVEIDLKQDYSRLFAESTHNPVPTCIPSFNLVSKGGPGAGDFCVVVAQSHLGKCFGKGTKIMMFDTSIKNIEDIVSGDKVMGWDGTSRTVTSLATGIEQMYWIRQKNGNDYKVNESHILCLKPNTSYIKDIKDKSIVKTIEVKDYLLQSEKWKKQHKGYKVSLEYSESLVKIDPYFLGIWLGDGISGQPMVCGKDKIIGEYIINYCQQINMNCKESVDENNVLYWRINKQSGLSNYIIDSLREYGIYNNKLIPQEYLYNSRNVRLQLLAGLLDTDGYLHQTAGPYEITQKRFELAQQIVFLSQSLGFRAKLKQVNIKLENWEETKPYYKVLISGNLNEIPVLLERKKSKKRISRKDVLNTSIKVEKAEIGEYFGFTLSEKDPDRMFLLEDFTVVHNTAFLTAIARNAAVQKFNVIYFSLETKGNQILSRAVAGLAGINQELIRLHPEMIKSKIDALAGNIKFIQVKSTSARISSLKSKVNELKAEGFFPDMIIVDGLNQVKPELKDRFANSNDKFEYLSEELRDFASEEEVPLYCAFQGNRGSFNVEYSDEQNIGKAIEVFQVADWMVMLTQTIPMQEANECYAQLLKNRLGPKGLMLKLQYDTNLGTFIELETMQRSLLHNKEAKQTISKGLDTIRERLRSSS